jgi:selenide,water dikinase
VLDRAIGGLIKRGCIPGGTRDNLATANPIVDWGDVSEEDKTILTDAQTSGGLLLSVPEQSLDKILRVLRKAHTPATAVIGRIVKRRRARIICMTK